MDVLVIGGTGSIGREVVRFLADMQHTVYVVSRSSGHTCSVPGVVKIDCDRHDQSQLARLIDKTHPNAIVDLAAYNRDDFLNTFQVFSEQINIYLTMSSVAVASVGEDGPVELPIREKKFHSDSNSMIPYAKGKLEMEWAALDQIEAGYKGKIVILRTGEVIGSADDREIYFFYRTLLNHDYLVLPDGGRNVVHPTDVRDVARAIYTLIMCDNTDNGIYHVAGPSALSLKALLKIMLKVWNRANMELIAVPTEVITAWYGSFYYPFFPRNTVIDTSRLTSSLNFVPLYDASDAFLRSYEILLSRINTAGVERLKTALGKGKLQKALSVENEIVLFAKWKELIAQSTS